MRHLNAGAVLRCVPVFVMRTAWTVLKTPFYSIQCVNGLEPDLREGRPAQRIGVKRSCLILRHHLLSPRNTMHSNSLMLSTD